MNDEPDPLRPHSLSSRFRYSHLYTPSLSRSFIEHFAFVCVCMRGYGAFVSEQVRRRLKGRQPGGRRRSKGFRLVPPTRTTSVVAAHPQAEAGQIK